MREHFPPPEQAGQPATATDDASASADAANERTSRAAAGADNSGFSMPPAESLADDSSALRWRQRLPWIFIGLLLLAIGAIAPMLVRKWQAEQALRQVASVAALPVAAPGLAAAPEMPDTSDTPDTSAPAMATAVAPASTLPGATAAIAGGAVLATATQQLPAAAAPGPAPVTATPPAPVAQQGASGAAGIDAGAAAPSTNGSRAKAKDGASTAMDAGVTPPKRSRAARSAKRDGVQERRVAKKSAARSSGTFKRCPPLGKKGAVICRWHICNGGAGKEAACRPYLERQP